MGPVFGGFSILIYLIVMDYFRMVLELPRWSLIVLKTLKLYLSSKVLSLVLFSGGIDNTLVRCVVVLNLLTLFYVSPMMTKI